ncbi:Crp/Fnr family transcriptional regulator [Gymnodinialimonas ulvae]|uniref:Crp/Fnr family transcriptional regulator n=1 Tax=Gymnodinialimonas ulvae TaxID=3126504 RepID=UPI0030A3CA4C
MDLTIWTAFGLLGVILYLTAYGALQLGFLRGSSPVYTILNLLAASFVLFSLMEAFNMSSLLIQVSWITLSIIGLARMAWERSSARFTEAERVLLGRHFTTLPPHLARKLLRLGRWQTVSPGTVLTRQGQPVRELIYLGSGQARVSAHGATMTHLGTGALIGEVTIMHGAEATADVEIAQEAHIFSLPRAALIRELQADHDFALAVAGALQIEAQRKLDASNRAKAEGRTDQGAAASMGAE